MILRFKEKLLDEATDKVFLVQVGQHHSAKTIEITAKNKKEAYKKAVEEYGSGSVNTYIRSKD